MDKGKKPSEQNIRKLSSYEIVSSPISKKHYSMKRNSLFTPDEGRRSINTNKSLIKSPSLENVNYLYILFFKANLFNFVIIYLIKKNSFSNKKLIKTKKVQTILIFDKIKEFYDIYKNNPNTIIEKLINKYRLLFTFNNSISTQFDDLSQKVIIIIIFLYKKLLFCDKINC